MSRRRTPSNTNLGQSNMLSDSPKASKSQRHRPQPSVEQPNLGMSPESRYNHNLKVLRRRDPSIVSIFDQFSHVCVYHHNGKMWEKKGFEGSMFLYERESYPPYGFYILNRMGMDDYIQRLYPEDVIGIHGSYLMLRSYPDFTSRRLAQALSSYEGIPHKFSDVYAVPHPEKLLDGDKGRSQTVGLWMFATDAREPMIDVMMRLHSYIKRNQPYPDEFRYGPERPPPPNPHLRTTSPSPPPQSSSGDQGLDRSFPSGSGSELDKLFARLGTVPSAAGPPQAVASSSKPKTNSTSKMTVASLFAALGGAEPQAEDPPPSASRSGIPLLDSIFASAEPTPSTESIPIYSPTPKTSVLPPQILNQEVITTLLGLPPSRSASASSTSYSSSHPSSREGDNEYEERSRGVGSDGFSESSTVLDPEAELDEELQAAGASAGRPLISVPVPRAPVVNGAGAARVNGKGRIYGDVTPRGPAVNGQGSARPRPVAPPMGMDMSGSASTIRPTPSQGTAGGSSRGPFVADAELWPPVNDVEELEDGEIVELDFEDTSALSDPDAFRQVLQQRRSSSAMANGHEGTSAASAPRERRDRGKGRKKGKRERAAERAAEMQRQRDEITRTWDTQEADKSDGSVSPSSLMSTSPSPHPSPMRAPRTLTPTTARPARAFPNGIGNGAAPKARARDVSGAAGLEPERAKDSIISAATAQAPRLPAHMERNEFVREVLTLIHTDKNFVDRLYHDYMTRLE